MKNFIWKLIGVWCFMLVLNNVYSQSIAVSDNNCEKEATTFTLLLDQTKPVLSSQTSIQWSFGDGSANYNDVVSNTTMATATHVYNTGQTYSVVVTITYDGAYPQQVVTRSVSVNKAPNGSFDYGKEEGACKGESVTLRVNTYGKNFVLWSTGDSFDGSKGIVYYTVTEAKLYKAIIYDENLCQSPANGQDTEDQSAVNVSFFEYPTIERLDTISIDNQLNITLVPKDNGYSEPITYEWSSPNGEVLKI